MGIFIASANDLMKWLFLYSFVSNWILFWFISANITPIPLIIWIHYRRASLPVKLHQVLKSHSFHCSIWKIFMNQSACSSKSTASFLFHKGVRNSYVRTAGQGRRQTNKRGSSFWWWIDNPFNLILDFNQSSTDLFQSIWEIKEINKTMFWY